MSVRLIILDRDGVINHDSAEFIKGPEEWRPIDGSVEAIAELTRAGFTIAIASNQSGIGRGLLDLDELCSIHDKMKQLVVAAGGHIDRIVFCPHLPDAGCDCRKPLPGLLHQLSAHYGVGLVDVPVVGDSLRDLLAAVAAGARPILVLTGNGVNTRGELQHVAVQVDIYDDLAAAADALIVEDGG